MEVSTSLEKIFVPPSLLCFFVAGVSRELQGIGWGSSSKVSIYAWTKQTTLGDSIKITKHILIGVVVELPDGLFLGYASCEIQLFHVSLNKQINVPKISPESAWYKAMTNTCLELTWLKYILQDLKVLLFESVLLYCDNQAALHITINPVFHERTKHIKLCYVSTKIQLTDVFPETWEDTNILITSLPYIYIYIYINLNIILMKTLVQNI